MRATTSVLTVVLTSMLGLVAVPQDAAAVPSSECYEMDDLRPIEILSVSATDVVTRASGASEVIIRIAFRDEKEFLDCDDDGVRETYYASGILLDTRWPDVFSAIDDGRKAMYTRGVALTLESGDIYQGVAVGRLSFTPEYATQWWYGNISIKDRVPGATQNLDDMDFKFYHWRSTKLRLKASSVRDTPMLRGRLTRLTAAGEHVGYGLRRVDLFGRRAGSTTFKYLRSVRTDRQGYFSASTPGAGIVSWKARYRGDYSNAGCRAIAR